MTIRFTFDGKELTAPDGSTVAGALLRSDIASWRLTRQDQRPRGIFCGIGVCFDCLVDVGDQRAVRACMTPLHDGDDVRTSDSTGGPRAS